MDKDAVKTIVEDALETHEPAFENFFLAKMFQLDIDYGDDLCIVEFPVQEYMFNPQGSLHGGVISFALDVSMGHLCKKFLGTCVTLEMKTQYLRPIKSGIARSEARFLKKGRKIVSVESRMFDSESRLIAIGTATWCRVES